LSLGLLKCVIQTFILVLSLIKQDGHSGAERALLGGLDCLEREGELLLAHYQLLEDFTVHFLGFSLLGLGGEHIATVDCGDKTSQFFHLLLQV